MLGRGRKSEPSTTDPLEDLHWRQRNQEMDAASRPASAVPHAHFTAKETKPSERNTSSDLPQDALQELRQWVTWSGETPTMSGDSILCQCKECKAPMSIRLWLMLAECWQCGASVQLSERSQLALKQWAHQEQAKPLPKPAPKAEVKPVAKPQPVVVKPVEVKAPVQKPVVKAPPKLPPIVAPPVQENELLKKPQPKRSLLQQATSFLETAPAWLVSLILHLLLLLLLAMFDTAVEEDRSIILSLWVDSDREMGDHFSVVDPEHQHFDAPIPAWLDEEDPEDQELIAESRELASELAVTNYEEGFVPTPIGQLKNRVTQGYRTDSALLARDVRVRQEVVKKEGGTLMTEAAVARALKWIANQQDPDGTWRLNRQSYHPGVGTIPGRQAGTTLALLPFLGAGQTHQSGIYKEVVKKGLRQLLLSQGDDGDLRDGATGEAAMYIHGQATIVLCEAYAMTGDRKLKEPAEKAIAFISQSQHSKGGWRYQPLESGDTSVLGWQLMALQSARMANIPVSKRTLSRAEKYLDSAATNGLQSMYAYRPGGPATTSMTAEALLCRMYLGWGRDKKPISSGLQALLRERPPSIDDVDFYYWYYGTQAFHHYGGDMWEQWNGELRDILVALQKGEGRHAGSWDVQGPLADPGGRLYVTSLAACTLEVYYRHLPLFERVKIASINSQSQSILVVE